MSLPVGHPIQHDVDRYAVGALPACACSCGHREYSDAEHSDDGVSGTGPGRRRRPRPARRCRGPRRGRPSSAARRAGRRRGPRGRCRRAATARTARRRRSGSSGLTSQPSAPERLARCTSAMRSSSISTGTCGSRPLTRRGAATSSTAIPPIDPTCRSKIATSTSSPACDLGLERVGDVAPVASTP